LLFINIKFIFHNYLLILLTS